MKTKRIKTGTKEEIVKYMRAKVKKMVMDVTNGAKAFGETGEKFSPLYCPKGVLYELESNTIEKQIDMFVQSGSPIVVVSLAGYFGVGTCREQFLLSDYNELRTEMEVAKLDDLELRDRRITSIKMIMDMELDAEERWDRILKVVDSYRGVDIPMEMV